MRPKHYLVRARLRAIMTTIGGSNEIASPASQLLQKSALETSS